jgi:hypothetical protein
VNPGDVQTDRAPFGDASLVWCPTCQGWAKPHQHGEPVPVERADLG